MYHTASMSRQQLEEALLAAEKRFQFALQSSHHILYQLNVREGKYDYMSPYFEELTGHPLTDFMRTTLDELQEYFHPEDRKRIFGDSGELAAAFRSRTGSSVNFSLEYRIRKTDGSYCWLSDHNTAHFSDAGDLEFFVGSAYDVTARKYAEETLRESELKYRTLFNTIQDAVFVTDATNNGKIIECNEQLSGYARSELLGNSTVELGLWENLDERQQVIEIVSKNGFVNDFETTFRRKDGTVFSGSISTNALKVGENIYLLSVVRDVTERKRAEDQRLHLEQQLLHAQKLESLGVLAGGIAHDFNNILTAIVGNADLALMRLNPESPVIDNLHRIEKAAARAADLARQMLAYSGKGAFVIEPIDLNRLVKEMGHMLEVSISKKAILRYDLTTPLPSVNADATQLRQVVMNLVINASEAIGDKSGIIAISTGCIECRKTDLKNVWLSGELPQGLCICLEISDTGCGMDRITQSKIFDPFFTTKFTGRGLGMAAVLGIVRGHNGAIRIYSEPGKGSTFKILFPASDRPAELFNETAGLDSWRGRGTALLVDDEETVRAIGSEMLRELGYEVITADDGREALEIYKTRKDIALVILDLTMPHMDGEQCFRELRLVDPDVKVIISSGFSEQEVTRKFSGKKLAGFIQKPYTLSALKNVLKGNA